MINPKVKIGILENDEYFLDEVKEILSGLEVVSEILTWTSAETFFRDPKLKNIQILFLDICFPE